MKKRRVIFTPFRMIATIILVAVLAGAALWAYLQDKEVPVFNPQGPVAAYEHSLMMFTLMLSAIVVVPVFIMIAGFAWRYRESNHKAKYTPDVEGNKWMEGLWWGIPILIIGILSVVTWVSSHDLDPYKKLDSNVPPLRVQVVALQWKWLFIYPDEHVASVNELRIPTGVPVNFEITADAPMSAFWVPNLGSQVYAMSGMTSRLSLQADRPGTYRGSNSNISGTGYADMAFNVIAMPTSRDFYLWTRTLANADYHNHLDWDTYGELAKPSRNNEVKYYHVHDDDIYTKIVNKYMGHGSMSTEEGSHDASHGEEDNR